MASATAEDPIRCHYDVLGVERDADVGTIKKAHRKLALKWHPDKNIGDDDSAQRLFLQVQQAYECLSDAAERKWYDDHRDAILKGWSATGSAKDKVDILFDVVPFMFAGCFKGYQDDPKGFYAVYERVFQQVFQGELEGCESSSAVDYLGVSFGASSSAWDAVVAFYQAWESFSSVLTYAWADQWNVQEAEQRRVRRAMDEDNKRARRNARRTRNEEVAALVHFVKRRDPRVVAKKEQQEAEKAARERELSEATKARKKEKEKAMEEWREKAASEFVAAEEEDRLRGRIRLADLEDDYDYGGGNKKGNGKKKKKKKGWSSSDEEEKEEAEHDVDGGETVAHPFSETDRLEAVPVLSQTPATDTNATDEAATSEDVSEPQKVDSWSCACCKEDFASKVQMVHHLKSKLHKETAAARKMEKNQEDEEDDPENRIKDKKKKKGKGWSSAEDEPVEDELRGRLDGPAGHPVAYAESAAVSEDGAAPELPQVHPIEAHESVSEEDEDIGEDESDSEAEPVFWRCECCQKDFQSEGQMGNHINSKKHRAAFKKYERVLGKKLLHEVIDELTIEEGDD